LTDRFSDKHIAVIGSGFGGLAEAIRLRSRGFRVTVFEKREMPGGRAGQLKRQGYTFDMGPSLITAPFIIEKVFQAAGKKMSDYLDLVGLDPFYRIYFQDRTFIDYNGDREKMKTAMARLHPADARRYDDFFRDIKGIYDAIIRDGLGAQPFLTLKDFLKFAPRAVRLNALIPVYSFAARYFKHEHHRFMFSFHPLFIGGSPFRAPSVYIMIPYLEKDGGCWYAKGGMHSVVEAFRRVFQEMGGELKTSAAVDEIIIEKGKAVGVRVAGQMIRADAVVSNGDVPFVYKNLVPAKWRRKWTDRALNKLHMTMSCFLLYLGVRKKFPQLRHHTIILGPHYRKLVTDILDRKVLPRDFSMYLHAPSKTDPSMAPPGCESIYALVPVPNLKSGTDWSEEAGLFKEKVLDYLEHSFGLEGLRAHLEVSEMFTPLDFQNELSSFLGNAFALEPRLSQSAYFRPHNRSEDVKGLYLVGAGTHPGGGVPGVLLSAEATERCILEDFKKMDDFLAEDKANDLFKASRLYTRHYARTFYFASFMLPKAKREAAYVIYAFCRYADNVLDDDPKMEPGDRLVKLQHLGNELDKVYYAPLDAHPRLLAFREIIRRYEIPQHCFDQLLQGIGMDLTIRRYETWEELDLYCYRVASVVGLIMAHIFGVSSEEAYPYAVQLGKAMQLTNILRDVKEDYTLGRIYLPDDDFKRFGCTDADLSEDRPSPALVELLKFEIRKARSFYREADKGIPYLTNDGSRFCVQVMSALYEGILDVIERNHYDVLNQRAFVPFSEKFLRLFQVWIRRNQ